MARPLSVRPMSFALAVVTLSACGGDPAPAPPGPPTAIAGVSATSLSGVVATTLDSLRVRVTDADGRGVPGVSVDYRVTAGGGSIVAPPPPDTTGGGLRTGVRVISTTDGMGNASASWTLGTAAGEQAVTADVVGLTTVTFTADAVADAPAVTQVTALSAFIGIAGGPADGPIGLIVTDQFGNPVPGVPVSWAAATGGGSVSASSVATDSLGVSQVTPMLGPAYGLHLFTGAAQGLPVDTLGLIAVTGVTDPADGGDPGAPNLVSHDVTFFGAANSEDILIFYFRFADNVVPPTDNPTQPSNAMWAIFDFDLDQDTTTGYLASRRCNGIDSLSFGSDGFVVLDRRIPPLIGIMNAPPGAVFVGRADSLDGPDRCNDNFFGPVATTVPVFRNNTVTVGVDLSFFADDGIMDFTSAFVSAELNSLTDLVPDSVPHAFDLSVAGTSSPFGAGFASLPRPLNALFAPLSPVEGQVKSSLVERIRRRPRRRRP